MFQNMLQKLSYWKFLVAFAAIIGLVAGGYFIWDRYFSEAGFIRRQANVLEKAEKDYVAAMTADTYGGKTPQETLDLFVKALRAGDVDLASKYFLLDENLSREKWVGYLNDVKTKGLLEKMATDIQQDAKSVSPSYEGDYAFALFGDDGTVGVLIDMQFNKHSKVWKIESL